MNNGLDSPTSIISSPTRSLQRCNIRQFLIYTRTSTDHMSTGMGHLSPMFSSSSSLKSVYQKWPLSTHIPGWIATRQRCNSSYLITKANLILLHEVLLSLALLLPANLNHSEVGLTCLVPDLSLVMNCCCWAVRIWISPSLTTLSDLCSQHFYFVVVLSFITENG